MHRKGALALAVNHLERPGLFRAPASGTAHKASTALKGCGNGSRRTMSAGAITACASRGHRCAPLYQGPQGHGETLPRQQRRIAHPSATGSPATKSPCRRTDADRYSGLGTAVLSDELPQALSWVLVRSWWHPAASGRGATSAALMLASCDALTASARVSQWLAADRHILLTPPANIAAERCGSAVR